MSPLSVLCDRDWIVSAAARLHRPLHDIEDIAHDLVVKLLTHRHLPELRDPRTYFLQVLRHRIVDGARWAARQRRVRMAVAERLLKNCEHAFQGQSRYLSETLDLVDRAIKRLPPKSRETMRRVRQGETSREIASARHESEETVRRRINRACKEIHADVARWRAREGQNCPNNALHLEGR